MSFLRWAGSKKQLIPELRSYWGKGFSRYFEPFMGSASLFFALNPPCAILSDINVDLVNVFCAVRDHPRAIYNRLLRMPRGKTNYYRIRSKDTSRLTSLDQAARFIYLNRFCFNGLYRTNKNGNFNVPFAPSRTGQLPILDDLLEAARTLSKAQISARDFEKTIQEVHSGDFVYMDPPYAVKNRRIFRQYGPDCFGTEDLVRLASALPNIDRSGATFLVSYALCPEALEAFRGWNIRQTLAQRSISGFSMHRCKAVELLISNRKVLVGDVL